MMDQRFNGTKHRFENQEYPSLSVAWTRPTEGQMNGPDGWIGTGTVWLNPNEKLEKTVALFIGQCTPLGHINWSINCLTYGALDFGGFPGTGITERDLFWLGELVCAKFNSRHELFLDFADGERFIESLRTGK